MYRVLKSISILFKFALLLLLWRLLFRKAVATTNQILNESIVFTTAQLEAFKNFDHDEQLQPLQPHKPQQQHRSISQITGRSFLCLPFFRVFNLELPDGGPQLAADETIAVSGDHYALGAWSIAKAVPLRAQNKQRNKWFLRQYICASHRVYYRYLIYAVDADGVRVLRRWEGQQVPRMLQTFEIYRPPGLDIFGQAYSRSVGGGLWLERGWLQRQYVIELKFIWERHLELFDESVGHKLRLKLRALSMTDNALIEVSRYGYNRSSFRAQGRRGVKYEDGDIVIFRISQALDVENAFRLSIYELDNAQMSLAEVYIRPDQLRGSRGIIQLPIRDPMNRRVIGQLTLPYLIIQPMATAAKAASNLRVSFQRYWPNNWPTLDVGNRGLGTSYYQASNPLVENTIESFLAVPQHKGDMVHLDVQLTRDFVPIIWRAFGFYTTNQPSTQPIVDRFDLRYVLIRQLSYAELKASRVFMLRRWMVQEFTHLNVRNVSQQQRLFPKLSEVYESLPKTLGLIVEIKWPQLMASGVLESTQGLNKNAYVDSIIEVTAHFGCGRPLIFASFDADICTMLRLKQTAFPSILMSTGRTNIWDAYMDLRTQTFVQAINFAESAEILGTAPHVLNFQPKQQQVNLGLDLLQVVFIWGSDLRDEQLLEQFRAIDVSGLIYDRMDLVGPASWKRSPFFQAPQLMEVFGAQCVAIGNSTTVPGARPTKPTVWPKMR
ncbi:glycerophosphocholine phosphodiesterase GPCPD1 [Drosophila grimshawi]|uniref:GH16958 n=1 Tax=Drosophila grimshawi TaxID=7222 RepID=B4IY55_DROGR|nr:glycerophosphocholine phosphodiesterase GPCPD1 [Drosophila grimshawi]EDV97598.1 GH16958 [Drosophila grimshawi]